MATKIVISETPPYFLDAVAYAKKIGFYRILAATNGIRYAEDIEFCKAAKAAGQHGVYLQFDGVSEEKNAHRGVGNLFDVKQQAIENLVANALRHTRSKRPAILHRAGSGPAVGPQARVTEMPPPVP